MRKLLLALGAVLLSVTMFAQNSKHKKTGTEITTGNTTVNIPMTADHWDIAPGTGQFVQYKGLPCLKISVGNAGPHVLLKGVDFSNGTIEFDVTSEKMAFISIYFRQSSPGEAECFYFRDLSAANPASVTAIQYTPILHGINFWDMMPHFQGGANIKPNDWNHVKLVINGKQMYIYVNDMAQPAMQVPCLEGSNSSGQIAFDGRESYLTNFTIKPNDVGDVPATEGYDPTRQDPRYLRTWQVNTPALLPPGQELYAAGLSKADSSWSTIMAERHGLINLTRQFMDAANIVPYNYDRKVVLLKIKLQSATAQKKLLRLGFCDEVWVFVNRKTVFIDKNLFAQNMRKTPAGRISIENSAFEINFDKGENELIVGISANFYGWGIVARLEDMEGVTVVQ